MSIALKVRNGCKNYTQSKILDNFNLTVRRGQIYCLIGPSGAGKTTLFSCILGITSLDSGEISIFGHNTEKSRKLAQLPQVVGYMPQETSLVEELTVSENLNFFANLYEMSAEVFEERYEVLRNVLEIPDDTRRVANCSGGQKRRISLAIAIMCEPKLLFLDEPTVGVDPILREKIWKFLRSSVEEKQTTVIVTTHYINEAEQSDCVGMLRQGRLLIEDSPRNIYEKFNLDGLDDVFALLCGKRDGKYVEDVDNNYEEVGECINDEIKEKRNKFSQQRVKALVRKEIFVLCRQPAIILLMLLLPGSSFYLFGQMFNLPANLPIAIINNEVNCSTLPQNYTPGCVFENLSCRRILEIEKSKNLKVLHYKTFDDAWKDGKAGKLYGIINFRKNLSQLLALRLEPLFEIENDVDPYVADYYPDHTDLHMTQFVFLSLRKSIDRFITNLLQKDCNYSSKLTILSPIIFEEPIYSFKDHRYLDDVISAYYFGMIFMTAIIYCCLSVIHDRKNGSWNRELLAGVSLFEVLTAHFIVNIFVMIFEFLIFFLIYKFTMTLENHGNIWIESILMVLIYISGIFFGLLFSCEVESYNFAVYTAMGLTLAQILISGSIWPFEGMHWFIKPFAYIFPATLPGKALKNMMIKGYECHSSIFLGYLVPIIWIACSVIGLIFVLRGKKFSGA